jgi:hypothetical protein
MPHGAGQLADKSIWYVVRRYAAAVGIHATPTTSAT